MDKQFIYSFFLNLFTVQHKKIGFIFSLLKIFTREVLSEVCNQNSIKWTKVESWMKEIFKEAKNETFFVCVCVLY